MSETDVPTMSAIDALERLVKECSGLGVAATAAMAGARMVLANAANPPAGCYRTRAELVDRCDMLESQVQQAADVALTSLAKMAEEKAAAEMRAAELEETLRHCARVLREGVDPAFLAGSIDEALRAKVTP